MLLPLQLLAAMSAAFVAFCAAASPPQGLFEPRCTSGDQYGWPRFDNRTSLQGSRWGRYFGEVYGALPSVYPVCVYDFWAIDSKAYVGT